MAESKLHPEAKLLAEYLEKQGKDRYSGKSIDEIRQNHSLSSATLSGNVDFKGKTRDIVIPSPHCVGKLRGFNFCGFQNFISK